MLEESGRYQQVVDTNYQIVESKVLIKTISSLHTS